MSVSLGLDVGSVSVKAVLISEDKKIIESFYIRSSGDPISTIISLLNNKIKDVKIDKIAVTGTGGKLVSELLGAKFVNEVIALSNGVSYHYPHIKTVFEMGGQDSKLYLFEENKNKNTSILKDFSMNTMCAAGTGSFLDQQATRLNIKIEGEFGEQALKSKNPPRMAGRCSVFAKSDMIHLQQVGTPIYDIIAGLCYAVTRSFKSNICQGKLFELPIAFLGGVASNAGMVSAFENVFDLEKGAIEVPKYHAHMPAIGAVYEMFNKHENHKVYSVNIKKLVDYKNKKHIQKSNLKKLHTDKGNNIEIKFPEEGKKIDAYLGIDIGSLSTNLAIIDNDRNVIARRYIRTAGKPIEAVFSGLKEISEEVGDSVNIKGVGTTGSGRYMIAGLIGADIVKNEITAQARAAVHFDPKVDTIFEIGGQDSKYISLKNGTVVDFEMNKVCAAGTGSFVEEQAERLGVDVKGEFSKLASDSKCPGSYGDRCTVFIESDLISAQQKGSSKEDLTAGLSYSIVNNYINKVVSTRKIGKKIFFQGGVAWNKAVLSAFENVTGKDIVVPPHHDITGAIGVSILAEEYVKLKDSFKTTFLGFDVGKIKYNINTFECNSCDNVCNVSKVEIEGKKPTFYGTRCEKYEVNKKSTFDNIPDLFSERDILLEKDYVLPTRSKQNKVIGIPKVLHFYEQLPFWKAFFVSLGFDVVVTGATSRKVIRNSIEHVKAELCFPAKIAHGHTIDLMEKGVDYIFMPSIINMEKGTYNYEENYNCPISQAIPYIIKSALDFNKSKINLIDIPVKFQDGEKSVLKELVKFGKTVNKSKKDIKFAYQSANLAQNEFTVAVNKRSKEIFANLDDFSMAAVLICRPYNSCDSGINIDLPKKLKDMGVLAIPIDYLPLENIDLSSDYPNMYWRSGQKMLNAASIVSKNEKLEAIFISNFGCGPDSFISYFLTEILKNKPYLQLEVDEHSADAGVVTRCEAFFDSRNSSKQKMINKEISDTKGSHINTPKSLKGVTVYFPYMCDHTRILSAAFTASGVKSVVLDKPDKETLVLGRKYTSGKECLPFIVTLGDFVKKVKSDDFDPEKSVFFMPQTSGPCRFGQYNRLQTIVFKELGYDNINMISPGTQDSYTDFGDVDKYFRRLSWQGIILLDFLQKITHRYRPYEIKKGKTDEAYDECLSLILIRIEKRNVNIKKVTKEIIARFKLIPVDMSKRKPVIGVVGEIFVRANNFSNDDVVRKIEDAGGEVNVAPIAEWVSYSTHCYKDKCKSCGDYFGYVKGLIQDFVQHKDEADIYKSFPGNGSTEFFDEMKDPKITKVIEECIPYIHESLEGEAVLSVGKAVEYTKRGVSGIVNVMPFTCMPGLIVTSMSSRFREDHSEIPWLNMTYDGQEDTNALTRIEAFVHQAGEFKKAL